MDWRLLVAIIVIAVAAIGGGAVWLSGREVTKVEGPPTQVLRQNGMTVPNSHVDSRTAPATKPDAEPKRTDTPAQSEPTGSGR